jgi:beta-carotene hydroxylase
MPPRFSGAAALELAMELRPNIAWPTLLLSAAVAIAYFVTTAMAFHGIIAASVAIILNTLLVYAAYTPLHEAVHGNIAASKGPYKWLNRCVGVILSGPMLHNFSLHQTTHLAHHKYLNDPAKDADHWTRGETALGVLLRCSTVIVSHYKLGLIMNYRSASGRRALYLGMLENSIWLALLVTLTALGYLREVLLFIVLPAFLGCVDEFG